MSISSDAKRAKTQLQLLPPLSLELIALCMQEGAEKYGVANWRETGIHASDYIGAAMRHLQSWAGGEDIDPTSGRPHLAHLGACAMVMLDALVYGAMEDDRPYKIGVN